MEREGGTTMRSDLHDPMFFAKSIISVSSSQGDGDTSQSCYDNLFI